MKKSARKTSKTVPSDPIKVRMRDALADSGVTQSSLAKYFEVTPQAVSEWFNPNKPGKCEPAKYVDLADKLGVNLRWLLSGTGPREGTSMSDEMFDLVTRFKLLTPEQREMVNMMIDGFIKKRSAPGLFKVG